MKENDAISNARLTMGKKLQKIHIRVGGEVDGHCEAKNAWNDAMKTLIP
jgi:hypothetical protein